MTDQYIPPEQMKADLELEYPSEPVEDSYATLIVVALLFVPVIAVAIAFVAFSWLYDKLDRRGFFVYSSPPLP